MGLYGKTWNEFFVYFCFIAIFPHIYGSNYQPKESSGTDHQRLSCIAPSLSKNEAAYLSASIKTALRNIWATPSEFCLSLQNDLTNIPLLSRVSLRSDLDTSPISNESKGLIKVLTLVSALHPRSASRARAKALAQVGHIIHSPYAPTKALLQSLTYLYRSSKEEPALYFTHLFKICYLVQYIVQEKVVTPYDFSNPIKTLKFLSKTRSSPDRLLVLLRSYTRKSPLHAICHRNPSIPECQKLLETSYTCTTKECCPLKGRPYWVKFRKPSDSRTFSPPRTTHREYRRKRYSPTHATHRYRGEKHRSPTHQYVHARSSSTALEIKSLNPTRHPTDDKKTPPLNPVSSQASQSMPRKLHTSMLFKTYCQLLEVLNSSLRNKGDDLKMNI